MRLLDRYLLRELLLPLGYCLSGFFIFWASADLITNLDSYQEDKLSLLDLVQFYFFRAPEFLVVVIPMALLLALLYALTNHARHQELTAMRSAGWSLWRICLPYLAVGTLLSLSVYLISELWLEESALNAERIRVRNTGNEEEAGARAWESNLVFRNDRDGRVWRVREFNLHTGEMKEPWVEWTLSDGTRCQLLAQSGIRTNRIWRFHDVRLFMADPARGTTPQQRVLDHLAMPEFTETIPQIRSQVKINSLSHIKAARQVRLTVDEIRRYQELHPELRQRDRAMLETQLHARLASPWTCLVVVLIAIPFGAPSGRRNVFVGVSCSILVCFLYYLCQRLALAAGTGGYLDPLLAGWLPNGLFAVAGIILTGRVR
ncbi:MAG: LptF/LptG family permease [Verrucomicrobia bacterium]|nr:LptF/LptG family permease [Verrucomicrobiota bacterium]